MMWKSLSEQPFSEAPKLKLNFGLCIFCGEEASDNQIMGGVSYHTECLTCPNCSEEHFILWRNIIPLVARCLNCLNKWELQNKGMPKNE